jgi:hypothetical protein
MIVSKSQSQAILPEERNGRRTSCKIGDSVLYHSLPRLTNLRAQCVVYRNQSTKGTHGRSAEDLNGGCGVSHEPFSGSPTGS